MNQPLRVALFTDSYQELNGVGTVSREFAAFAKSRNLPFCCVSGGPETTSSTDGSVLHLQLKRSLISFPLDTDLYCDPLLNRYLSRMQEQLAAFRPDVIQITSPGDLGILGFWVSNRLGVPLAASWHTNLHEYAGRRIHKTLRYAHHALRELGASTAERLSMKALVAYYRLAHFVLSPNQAMVDVLETRTGRPSFHMKHGVDSARFSSDRLRRNRDEPTGPFCIGWVGRLTPEKNVRAFAELEAQLLAAGETNFRFLMVGDGSEKRWLETHLKRATLPGALHGDDLVAAFASMDAFVFPSETDTFGLVILEAMSSGVPVLLGRAASERVGLQDGSQGFVGSNYCEGIQRLMHCEALRKSMSAAAKTLATAQSWKLAFEELYVTYEEALIRKEVTIRLRPERRAAIAARRAALLGSPTASAISAPVSR